MKYKSEILLDKLMFPEAPRWRDNKLWFTDQHAKKIITVNLNGENNIIAEMDDLPGGLGWLPDNTLLVVSMTQRKIMKLENDKLKLYADLSNLVRYNCNDLLVDQKGRAYVSNFGYDLHNGGQLQSTSLILIDESGISRFIAQDLIFPNGMVINSTNTKIIVAETFACRLTSYNVNIDGSLCNRDIFVNLENGYPDGICLDQDEAVWAAIPNKNQVIRINHNGEVCQTIKTQGQPYACMLGGNHRKTLFICTSETDNPELACKQKSGRIEIIDVDVPGNGLP